MSEENVMGPEDVLTFWLEECGPEDWYTGKPALDRRIRERFLETWEAARDGRLRGWRGSPRGSLAKAILLDQFPRNMFRDDPRAFSTDALAREVACQALARDHDLKVEMPGRQFLYMPFEHSESMPDQERAVRLMKTRTESEELLLHARAHREIIRRFGRFPFRNAALGRRSNAAETEWLEAGAYGAVVRRLKAEAAA